LAPWVELVPITRVCPSGFARATNSAAIEPLAPGLLSTVTGWPMASLSFWASRRAPMSVPLPGPNGTTMLIGRLGNASWAVAGSAMPIEAAHSRVEMRCFMVSPWVGAR
jgi:hypothetical protein